MKPTFALDLSRDRIALLHRTPKGWLTIGEVAFDAADLNEALDFLRKTALGLSPLGLASKVILPNSQILYSEIHAPGPSREDKRRQIATALQGRTPYAVEDLVFDWSGKGSVVRVAVVARETLEEAEAFALAHRLNPVSFVAIPEEGTFFGEAWFGPASSADAVLAPGEAVDRDREAVIIIPLTAAAPVSGGVTSAAGSVEPDDLAGLPGLAEALSAEVSDSDLAAVKALPTEPSEVTVFGAEDADLDDPIEGVDLIPPAAVSEPEAAADSIAEPTLAETAAEAAPEAAPAPSEAAAEAPSAPEALPDSAPAALAAPVEPEEAPFTDVIDEAEPDDLPGPAATNGDARVLSTDILDDDLPPAPSPAAMMAFSSRRSVFAKAPSAAGAGAPPVTLAQTAPSGPQGRAALGAAAGGAAAGGAATKLFSSSVTAPTIPGSRPRSPFKSATGAIPRPIPPGPTTVKSPARPNGTFGAAPAKRSRTGFTFMLLIGLLLLSLALVAAWASFFLTQAADDAGTGTTTEVVEVPAVEVPAIEDEMAADLQDPGEFAASEETAATAREAEDLAALVAEEMPVNIGGDASGTPPEDSVAAALDEAAVSGDPAAGTEAMDAGIANGAAASSGEPPPASTIATDVSGSRTPVEDQDEIFLAAMDAPPPVLDALALPTPSATTDALPDTPMPPPAFGTVYQFDAQGLLVPTPEGLLSPDGIMLFAGAPPLTPPARSPAGAAAAAELAASALAPAPAPVTDAPATDAATAADASLVTAGDPATAETPVVPAPSDPAMAGFRPKPRPAGLVVPADDGASLETEAGTEAGTEVASLRPLARPASVAAAAEAANPGTEATDLGAQGASLTAQAEAQRAAAEALEASNPSIVAISMRPEARPSDLSRAVEAAVAVAVREPDPAAEAEVEVAAADPGSEGIDEPETDGAAPSIPTKASVAKQATYANAINLKKVNLIGTFGTSSKPYALVRLANGKYKKVKVGDKIDGGVVKAITENEVRYQKGGKLVSLKMPKA